MNNKQTIGLFGFGNVGSGLFEVLEKGKTVDAEIKSICIKNPEKQRKLPSDRFTTNPDDLLNDPDINLIVELIDDSEQAYNIVKKAMVNGKSVVSGNKRMLAYHLDDLIEFQKKHNVALLYEASACGSIPIIRNLEEYYDNDLLKSITGILNGSSNYILTKLFTENMDYQTALKQAQDLGFAESNPKFDVEGYDSLYKLIILTLHSVGTYVNPEKVFHYGITSINEHDIAFANEKGLKIKLIGQLLKIGENNFTMFVMPRLVNKDNYIYNVENEYNGVVIEGECYDKQFMFGKGAGSFPTGSAILSDITARMHNYKYEYKKLNYFKPMKYNENVVVEIYLRYKNTSDFSLFQFEQIHEKYTGRLNNYVVGKIKLSNLFKLKSVLTKLDVFFAFTGNVGEE
jgi:homoserine dehydrogenase